MKRSWTHMRAKCSAEGRCRACARPCSPDAAHIVARARVRPGAGEHEDNCVPLCRPCHRDFDEGRLDLLGLLSAEEVVKAVELYDGDILSALRRLTGQDWAPRK